MFFYHNIVTQPKNLKDYQKKLPIDWGFAFGGKVGVGLGEVFAAEEATI
jgi:hypothetical protein